MARKSFKIQSQIKLEMICVPNVTFCQYDHVYMNIELFGETQRTRLFHPIFPIQTKDEFCFEKTFWSPKMIEEVFVLLKESPVSIELRLMKHNSSESILLAYTDMNAHQLLVNQSDCVYGGKSVQCIERVLNLKTSEFYRGAAPRVKLVLKTTITSSASPVIDHLMNYKEPPYCPIHDTFDLKRMQRMRGGNSLGYDSQIYSCDCNLHSQNNQQKPFHCKTCHQNFTADDTKNNQYSNNDELAIVYRRSYGDFDENDDEEDNDDSLMRFKDKCLLRPPFIVRKLDPTLTGRKPDAYDSVYNQAVREVNLSKRRQEKKLLRLRSSSPERKTSKKVCDVCYACKLTGENPRLNCDACNLTSRGEPSYRSYDLVRPEPPLLRTSRETTDQRAVHPTSPNKCQMCLRDKMSKIRQAKDDSCLLTSSRPIHQIDGYRQMAKYFDSAVY